jgi:hypothetical protein
VSGPTSPRDPLEDRLRDALRQPGPPDRLDPDDLLRTVHSGARRRRTRRLVATCSAVAVILGGGFTVLSGVLDSRDTPVADPGVSTPVPSTGGQGSAFAPRGSTSPSPSVTPGRGVTTAADAVPVSLTATGTDYQWVLAGLDDGSCASRRCAVVYGTANAGGSWSGPTRLDLPVATTGFMTASDFSHEVSGLRFSRPTSGEPADGWAFGGALLSTHDSGLHWRRITLPVAGAVTHLAAWRNDVYATVNTGSGVAVVRSPAGRDSWSIVDTRVAMTSVSDLAATRGEIALISETGDGQGPHVVVSGDGTNWNVESPCPSPAPASQLSTAADPTSSTDGLWLVCSSHRTSLIKVTLDSGIHWMKVQAPAGSAILAARSTDSSVAVTDGVVELLRPGYAPVHLADVPVRNAVYAGFTNAETGYIIEADGGMWRTGNAGKTWSDYSVH